jgi:hypothetical protein
MFKLAIKNCNFMLAMFSSSLQIVFIYVFATIMGQLVSPFGFDDSDFLEVLGILNNGLGIIGAILASLLLRGAVEKDYKKASIISNVLTLLSFGYFILAVWYL